MFFKTALVLLFLWLLGLLFATDARPFVHILLLLGLLCLLLAATGPGPSLSRDSKPKP